MKRMDKSALKDTLLKLEQVSIHDARAHYETYLKGALLDSVEVGDTADQAQIFQSGEVAQKVEHQLHAHERHLQKIRSIDFDRKQIVEEGAVVEVNGRHLVIAVPTPTFEFNGVEMLGMSADAPLATAMAGLRAGDTFEFNRKRFEIAEVH
jgi:predicted methyltransferase